MSKEKNVITKAELFEKFKDLPDNAEITLSAFSWEELNGKWREYSITVESMSINVYGNYASIRLRDEKPED